MKNILLFIGPIVLWSIAIVISIGKASFLIAGYNTGSKEEKEKYNEKALCKFMGKFLFLLGVIQLALPIGTLLKLKNFDAIAIWTNIIFIAVIIAGIIYMNTSKKFRAKKE